MNRLAKPIINIIRILLLAAAILISIMVPKGIITRVAFDLTDPAGTMTELFYCLEKNNIQRIRIPNENMGVCKSSTDISIEDVKAIRLDVTEAAVRVEFRSVKFYYLFWKVYEITPGSLLQDFQPVQYVSAVEEAEDHAVIVSEGQDPILRMRSDVYEREYGILKQNLFQAAVLTKVMVLLAGMASAAAVQKLAGFVYRLLKALYAAGVCRRMGRKLMKLSGFMDEKLDLLYQPYMYCRKHWRGCFLLFMLLAIMVLFHQYFLGERIFLFPELNSDGFVQFYPMYYLQNEHLHEFGNVIGYSFKNGLGGEVSTLNPFTMLFLFCDRADLPYLLWAAYALKIFLAGLFFLLFLWESKMCPAVCCIGGICYAFSAQVVVGGLWGSQAESAIALAMLLYAIERCMQKRKYGWLLGSGLFLYFVLSDSYIIVTAGILLLFEGMRAAIRLLNHYQEITARITVKWIWFLAAGVLCIFILFAYRAVSAVLQNDGIIKNIASMGNIPPIFSLENLQLIGSAFMRTVSHTVLGIAGDTEYFGTLDYLTGGSFGCGILCLLLYPQIFAGRKRGEKVLWAGWSLLLTLLLCFPKLRFALQGFSGYGYKNVRLLGTLLLLWPALLVLNDAILRKKSFCYRLLLHTAITVMLCFNMGVFILFISGKRVFTANFLLVNMAFCFYLLLLSAYKRMEPANRAIWKVKAGILALLSAEAVLFNYGFINNSDSLDRTEFAECFINDGTREISEKLSLRDSNIFYRTNKAYFRWYSDAGAQGHNGTSYYSGTLSSVTQDFLKLVYQLGLPTHGNRPGYFAGTYGYPYVSAILSCKYGLARESRYMEYGYERKHNEEGIEVYENEYFLPMGVIYHKAVKESDYERLGIREKMSVLLAGAVLEDEVFEELDMEEPDKETYEKKAVPSVSREYRDVSFGDEFEVALNQPGDTLEIYIEAPGMEQCMKVYWRSRDGDYIEEQSRMISSYAETGGGILTLSNQEDISHIRINSFPDSITESTVPYLRLSVYDSEEYYQDYRENIAGLRKNCLRMEAVSDEYIKGTIDMEKEGICYFPILSKAPFQYLVDGVEAEPIRVHYGFTGIWLEKGIHEIQVVYTSTFPFYQQSRWIADLFGRPD